jgi:membrane protein YqaA with SNARE-associated domain
MLQQVNFQNGVEKVVNVQENIINDITMEKEIQLVLGIVSIVLMIVAFLYRNKLGQFKKYGYLGIFLISAIGNMAILSPAAPMVAALGATIYHPVIVSFITTLGAVTGELLSYFIGSAGQTYIPDSEWNTKITHFMKINGSITLFVLSVIPNPFFDVAGIAAGATNYPLWKFIVISFFGKWIKFGLFALMGKKINTMLK